MPVHRQAHRFIQQCLCLCMAIGMSLSTKTGGRYFTYSASGRKNTKLKEKKEEVMNERSQQWTRQEKRLPSPGVSSRLRRRIHDAPSIFLPTPRQSRHARVYRGISHFICLTASKRERSKKKSKSSMVMQKVLSLLTTEEAFGCEQLLHLSCFLWSYQHCIRKKKKKSLFKGGYIWGTRSTILAKYDWQEPPVFGDVSVRGTTPSIFNQTGSDETSWFLIIFVLSLSFCRGVFTC